MSTIDGKMGAVMAGGVAAVAVAAIGLSALTGVGSGTAATPTPAATPAPSASAAAVIPAVAPYVAGWMPYWDMAQSMKAVSTAPDLVKEASPFWYDVVQSGGKVTIKAQPVSDGYSREKVTSELQALNVSVIPTITDATPGGVLSAALQNKKEATRLADEIVSLTVEAGYDGIDLDWENFAFVDGSGTWGKTQPAWVSFVTLLGERLHAEGKLLAVTTPVMTGKTSGYWVYDWESIAPHIDRLRVMTYDYSYASPGPVGPLWWAERAGKYAVSVVEREKVQLGVAAYGRNWVTGITGLCPSNANVKRTTVSPADASRIIREAGGRSTWMKADSEARYTYERRYKQGRLSCTVSREMWFPTSRSLRERFDLAERLGVAGIAIWPLGDTPKAFLTNP